MLPIAETRENGQGGAAMAWAWSRVRMCMRWAMLSLLILSISSPALAQDDEPNVASPANRQARVIAQTVTELPEDEVAWRVTEEEAPLPEDADFAPQPLSFVYAVNDAILIVDEATNTQVRLAGGEAAALRQDASTRLVSLGDEEAPFIRIALVPADQAEDEPEGGNLVFASDPFFAPEGNHDLDLVSTSLGAGTVSVESANAPFLVYSTRGELTVRFDDENESVDPDESAAFGPGKALITDAGDIAGAFLAAVIGPAIPDLADAGGPVEPTPDNRQEGDTALVSVQVTVCPAGHTFPDQLDGSDPDCVDPAGDLYVSLTSNDTGEVREEFTDDSGAASFGNLPAGSYSLATFLDGATDARFVCGSDQNGLIGNGDSLPVNEGEEIDCTVNFALGGGETLGGAGEIVVSALDCPDDYTVPDGTTGVDPNCASPLADVYIYLEQLDGGTTTVDGTTGGDGTLDFTDLPTGTYSVSAGPNSSSANVWINCSGPDGPSGDIAIVSAGARTDCFIHVSDITQ
jgi:hypothetical protein